MGTPWGMISARREAEKHRQDAWQASENEKILRQSLVNLITTVEDALKDLEKVEASRHVRKKLQEAINKALEGRASNK